MNPEQPKLLKSAAILRKFSKRKKYRLPEKNFGRKGERIHELDFLNFLARVQG